MKVAVTPLGKKSCCIPGSFLCAISHPSSIISMQGLFVKFKFIFNFYITLSLLILLMNDFRNGNVFERTEVKLDFGRSRGGVIGFGSLWLSWLLLSWRISNLSLHLFISAASCSEISSRRHVCSTQCRRGVPGPTTPRPFPPSITLQRYFPGRYCWLQRLPNRESWLWDLREWFLQTGLEESRQGSDLSVHIREVVAVFFDWFNR